MPQLVASESAAPAQAGPLSMLVYRSRAVRPMTPASLDRLALAAQRRNRAERLTGLVVYDESRFFQWLEGPQASLDRVMRSINDDRRHDEIEVIDHGPTASRTFGGWAMQLATRSDKTSSRHGAMEPPREILSALHRAPSRTSDLLARLAPPARRMPPIEAVVRDRVIPELLSRHRMDQATPRRDTGLDAPGLARLLLAGRRDEADATMRAALTACPSLATLHERLIAPAARHLGDLWLDDACSEVEVTLALCEVQSLLAGLRRDATPSRKHSALVVPAPGEGHLLGAALAAAGLGEAGWAVRAGYPADTSALQASLKAAPVTRLHLALSPAFRREDALPRLETTIARARATGGATLTISVSGRIFAEGVPASAVGADRIGAGD